MLRIMCKRQHDNSYSKNLPSIKAQHKIRDRDDQALLVAFQNDRIKPSTFDTEGVFVRFTHTWCAHVGHERTAWPRSTLPPWHPCSSVPQRDAEDPWWSWVAGGATQSCTKFPRMPVSWARSCTTGRRPWGTAQAGRAVHEPALLANSTSTGPQWSFGGRPALRYPPVLALHWSAREIKSPALAFQVQHDQLGSTTARDGAPTQLSPWPQMLTWFWTTSLSGRKKKWHHGLSCILHFVSLTYSVSYTPPECNK